PSPWHEGDFANGLFGNGAGGVWSRDTWSVTWFSRPPSVSNHRQTYRRKCGEDRRVRRHVWFAGLHRQQVSGRDRLQFSFFERTNRGYHADSANDRSLREGLGGRDPASEGAAGDLVCSTRFD